MANENSPLLIKKVYRQALQRLVLINLSNNLIFFTIFGVIVFDFSIILGATFPFLQTYLLTILLILIPALSIAKTFFKLPSEYYILASIDHHAATRGTFSLLNELTNREPANNQIDLLYNKCTQQIKTISMRTIFPWKFIWNGYLGAILTFTALLWVAIPQHKNIETHTTQTEIDVSQKDFTIDKKDPIYSALIKNTPEEKKISENNTASSDIQKTLAQKNANEKNKVVVKNDNDSSNSDTPKSDDKIKPETSEAIKSNTNNASKGSGNQEAHSNKTIEINKAPDAGTNLEHKITLDDAKNQDGSSTRMNSQGYTKKVIEGNKVQLTNDLKTQKIEDSKGLVSSKYQKIIERYFSSDE